MKNTLYKSFLFVSIALFTLSCFGEDDGDEIIVENCNYDYELDHYNNMMNVFNVNPTEANCNNLRSAALSLIDALEGCSDYDYYYEATQAWLQIDCSGLGNGNGNGTGKATFWTQSDFGCGNISVYISNTSGTISGYFSGGNPGCEANASANFQLTPGTYEWTASCGNYNWNGNITVNEGSCSTMQLTL